MRTGFVRSRFLKAGIVSGSIIGLVSVGVAFILISANITPQTSQKDNLMWQAVQVFDPLGAGEEVTDNESGFIMFALINLSDANGYKQNNSDIMEDWAEANMPGLTPHSGNDSFYFETESEKTFAVLVMTQYNYTHVGDAGVFIDTRADCQLTMTCTDWVVGANINNVSGTRCVSSNNSGYGCIYINWVWDNGGTGYQIADGSTWAVPEIYIEANF